MTLFLLDIEGTTTPISFVHDTLFPFARERARSFLERRIDEPEVAADVELLLAQHREDHGEDADLGDDAPGAITAIVHEQMDRDLKSTGLKSLQGKIWKDGYASGDLLASVFDDVPDVLRALHDQGTPARIYSSGSIAAQKLLFGHTASGDLNPLLAGYFDTTTGPKKVASSYEAIADACGVATSDIVFCTDNIHEARAAREAGTRAIVIDRPGNAPLPEDHDFEVWTDLEGLRSL